MNIFELSLIPLVLRGALSKGTSIKILFKEVPNTKEALDAFDLLYGNPIKEYVTERQYCRDALEIYGVPDLEEIEISVVRPWSHIGTSVALRTGMTTVTRLNVF